MQCFLCKHLSAQTKDFKGIQDKVKEFSNKTWLSCTTSLKARQQHQHQWNDVELPENWDNNEIGYHSQCYKKFIVKKQFLLPESETPSTSVGATISSVDEADNLKTNSSNLSTSWLVCEAAVSYLSTEDYSTNSSFSSAAINLEPVNVSVKCTRQQLSRDADDIENADEMEVDNDIVDDSIVENEQKCQEKCFFCGNISIKWKGRKLYCSQTKHKIRFFDRIRSYATEMNDVEMLMSIHEEVNNENIMLFYHQRCSLKYFSNFKAYTNKPPTTIWTDTRGYNEIARKQLIQYIEKEVVSESKIFSVTYLQDIYILFLQEVYESEGKDFPENLITTNTLRQYMEIHLKKKIKFEYFSKKWFVMSVNTDLENINDDEILDIIFEQECREFAIKYRKKILQIKKKPLPDFLDAEALNKGECDIPNWLNVFWKTALSGTKVETERIERLTACLASDSIYSITKGNIKPRKQIIFGMSMKSLTGNVKVMEILNRCGYSISYSGLAELESSAAYSCIANGQTCPSGIIPTSSLACGVAWDNYDRFVETQSGKNTLHDTVGIAYQDIPAANHLIAQESHNSSNVQEQNLALNLRNKSNRRKRSFESFETENLPPTKQKRPEFISNNKESASTNPTTTVSLESTNTDPPTSNEELFINEDNTQGVETSSTSDNEKCVLLFKQINFCWIFSHKLHLQNVPMWVGYNAKISNNNSTIQKIDYLTQINDSPTDPRVIKETMRLSLKIASECGKKYFNVTYDLAIAKIALKIQSAEEEFKNLFIHLGSFHIMLSFFKAVGKFINGCGLTNMLVDAEVLANGSINTFLTGKHFNRCCKIHPIISLALQLLHVEFFLENKQYDLETIKTYLKHYSENENENPVINNELCHKIFEDYAQFKKDTLQGNHGKTPQIFMMYIQLIDYYLMLEFSIRTANFDIYKYVLEKMTNIFFAFNHQNYARYLTIYLNKLEKIEETHPGLIQEYGDCFFGIRRTTKPFSRNPIDITLEQTINAHAASRSSGIINMTNSVGARQKWAITHSLRTNMISKLMDFCNLYSKDDITKDLRKSSICHSNKNVENLLTIIQQCTNPFSSNLSQENLYNISSGQSVSEDIYTFLSNIETTGELQRIKFITESQIDPERFDKAILKNTVVNFASKCVKKVKINGKVKEVTIQRDIFGRLLYASLQSHIDLKEALKYPLTPIPFSLCHSDGSICKTQKSVIFEELKSYQEENGNPPKADIHIYDGFYLLHTLKNVPNTYGKISMYIFKLLVSDKKEVHIIFDKFNDPSIKDYEHRQRGEDDTVHSVHKNNKRPSDFGKLLRSKNFKESFVEFLIDDWTDDCFVILCQDKIVKLSYGTSCYSYQVHENHIKKTTDYNLCCFHEEADTKIMYHICQLPNNYNVEVHCTDSDIPVIILANMKYLKADIQITVNMCSNKKREYLNMNKIYQGLGDKLARALTVCHIFTGNDFNPAFYRKGKKRPFAILKKKQSYQDAFMQLLETVPKYLDTEHEVFKSIEEYVCQIYSLNTKNDIDKGRFEVFERKYKNKNENDKIWRKNLKGFDASNLPPTKKELLQHIKRTIYISNVWCNAHLRRPTDLDIQECGWLNIDGSFEFFWFDGEQCPTFREIAAHSVSTSDDQDEGEPSSDESEDEQNLYLSEDSEFEDNDN
ncbi:uncharacterized protein LOC126883969 [Diabrotica virgifera virgifera]|uniref:Uncharacterized protein n=1 Tax=Diabrotica virgifera virgifera TaxID=50390 RepID=A0ABM5K687_DIAVI|nr:uncharacterized protein LOC126883969 [Diabrotica virgifera virgifera]